MDALQGVAYEDDEQVVDLRPRDFGSAEGLRQLAIAPEPMSHFEIEDVAPAALFPLSTGVTDYYVMSVRAAT